MRIFETKPALRWLAPVAVLALVGGTGLLASSATAEDKLPSRTAEQLLVDLQTAEVAGMSGTVVQQANLGIPAIPGAGGTGATSMLSGSHTLRVWYAAPNKARVALVDTFGESDMVTNGTDLWTWSSQDNAATHRALPSPSSRAERDQLPEGAPRTPQDAATWALKALGPTTNVSTASDVTVAGEPAYEVVLTPKASDSLLTRATIAIDGDTHVPLQVQAFAGDTLVFEVGYSSVSFDTPDDAQFTFNPPADTKVTEVAPEEHAAPSQADREQAERQAEAQRDRTTTVGTGWSTVVVSQLPSDSAAGGDQAKAFLQQLTPVSGTWGSGRLLKGTAFSAVLTDDGRVAVGSVQPELLYQALAK